MERNVFGEKVPNVQRPRVDRFVASRNSVVEMCRRKSWDDESEKKAVNIWSSKSMQQKKFSIFLDEAFGLEPLRLDFRVSNTSREYYTQPWPCIPRRKSYLLSADSILDLPTYSTAVFPELLDWSNDNMLVAALGRHYYKWSWRSQSLISQGVTIYKILSCKFNPRGDLLALGTEMSITELHNSKQSKYKATTLCRCELVHHKVCSIIALDWSPTGNSFVSGCTRGVVMTHTRSGRYINFRVVSRGPILVARVSPDARYVAITSVQETHVTVLTWPNLDPFSTLSSDYWNIEAIAWHPWRSALLGVGAMSPSMQARLAMLDVPSARVRGTDLGNGGYNLDAMLFSHKTGELVLSLWKPDAVTTHPNGQLVVMSDPETVVDQWGEGKQGLDRVRTMMFSPDGTKLATATEDEDLIIWNFLPEDNIKNKKSQNRRFARLPFYMDITTNGNSIR